MIKRNPLSNAARAASYMANYLYCVESLPDEIQRFISKMRQLDAQYYANLSQLNRLRDEFVEICSLQKNKSNDLSLDERKRRILSEIKLNLLRGQMLSDDQLKQMDCINSILETRAEKLDQEYSSLASSSSENFFKNVSSTGSTANGASSKPKNDLSDKLNATDKFSRSEKRVLSVLARSTVVNESSDQPSNKASSSALPHRASYVHKRPRRQRAGHASHGLRKPIAHGLRRSSPVVKNQTIVDRANSPPECKETSPQKAKNTEKSLNNTEKAKNVERPLTNNNDEKPKSSENAANNEKDSLRLSQQHGNPGNREGYTLSSISNAAMGKKRKRATNNDRTNDDNQDSQKLAKMKYSTPVEPDEPTYCLCEQVSYGEMIGCDNNECQIEWYHFNCVSLTSKPKGKWYCPNCRGDKPTVMKD